MMRDPIWTTPCLSSLRCDQWLNGEIHDDEVTAHLASCPRCAARLAAHRRERATFAVPLPRVPRERGRTLWLAMAAAAALVVWFVVSPRDPERGEREKGKPSIGFYVKHRDAIRRGGGGERVFPGDALDFTASTPRPAYLAIISVDGAGTANAYYPDGAAAAFLPAGREQLLPLGVRLDDVLGTERLVGVFCAAPMPVASLTAAIARGEPLPDGCVTDATTLEKWPVP
jgi:hypothetical protein